MLSDALRIGIGMLHSIQRQCLVAVFVLGTVAAACAGWWWSCRVTPETSFRLAWIALNKHDWRSVSRHIEELQASPDYASHRRLLRGALLLRTGNSQDALPELFLAEQNEQLREQSWLLLCESYYAGKNWQQAKRFAKAVLSLNPKQPDAHRWLGAIYFDMGAMGQAETHLKILAEVTPNDYSPHRLLGLIHGDFEQFKVAIADYREALRRSPPKKVELEIRRELTKALIRMNEFEQALETLQVDWPANEVRARALRAECLWALGQREEALRELAIAEEFDPRDVPTLQLNATIALMESRTQDAIRLLEKVTEIEPANDRALMDLSAAYRRLGQSEVADKLLQKRNEAHDLLMQLAKLSRQAIEEPNNSVVRLQLSEICLQLGKVELAATWRDAARALAADPPQ